MTSHLSFDNNEAAILAELANNLRVLIDLRYRVKQHANPGVIDLQARRMQTTIDELIKKHQLLIGPSASFLTKHGEEVTFNEYHALANLLTQVEAQLAGKKENTNGRPNPKP